LFIIKYQINICSYTFPLYIYIYIYIYIYRWSLIAGRVPGRTDNQVKNHWNTHLSKKLGIKKRKCKISDSSSKLSEKSEANFHIKLSSNDESIPCNNNTTEIELQNVIESSHEKAKEITSTHEPTIRSDCYENFWLSYEDPYLCIPSLMELSDEFLGFFMAWNVKLHFVFRQIFF